ncbi:MAG: hypothetical protein J5486_03760 [Bacteroidaceae bacterium]|nr:hypothetical protein [Bacteroidaceae bacterium]
MNYTLSAVYLAKKFDTSAQQYHSLGSKVAISLQIAYNISAGTNRFLGRQLFSPQQKSIDFTAVNSCYASMYYLFSQQVS